MRTPVMPLLLALSLASPVLAARSLPADRPIAVKLEPSQPTAIALPEPVASVSVGLAPDRVSLDYDGPYLFLLPLDPAITGRLFVVGQSGTLYVVTFKVAAPADDVVHVTATPAGATQRPPHPRCPSPRCCGPYAPGPPCQGNRPSTCHRPCSRIPACA